MVIARQNNVLFEAGNGRNSVCIDNLIAAGTR